MIPPLKEKPLEGSNWTRPWYLFFDGLNRYVTGLINALKFTDLTDTPSSYTGQAGKVVKVNAGATGLEFGTAGVTDHTLLTNIGINTHAQIDTAVINSVNHIANSGIHFTQAQIDHVNILNKGTNTHAQIDSHIADGNIHFEQVDIDHTNILNIGIYTHNDIDNHIDDGEIHELKYDKREWVITAGLITGVVYKLLGATVETMTITYDGSDRPLQYSYSSGKVVNLTHLGTGFLSEAL